MLLYGNKISFQKFRFWASRPLASYNKSLFSNIFNPYKIYGRMLTYPKETLTAGG